MTHAELVRRAERWLRGTARCGVVLTEAPGGGVEIPDAIGWTGGYQRSILIECKVSRADYLADRKKVFRQWACDDSLGFFRYFMVPSGLVKPDELLPRWGLLEVQEKIVRRTVRAKQWNLDRPGSLLRLKNERSLLLSELRKIQIVQAGGSLFSSRSEERIARMLSPDPA